MQQADSWCSINKATHILCKCAYKEACDPLPHRTRSVCLLIHSMNEVSATISRSAVQLMLTLMSSRVHCIVVVLLPWSLQFMDNLYLTEHLDEGTVGRFISFLRFVWFKRVSDKAKEKKHPEVAAVYVHIIRWNTDLSSSDWITVNFQCFQINLNFYQTTLSFLIISHSDPLYHDRENWLAYHLLKL